MREHIIKDLGMKQVGKHLQRFALIKCPECGTISERRVRSDSKPHCRACAMKQIRSKRKCDIHGDSVKTSKYHRLYNIWRSMIRRCYDVKSNGYVNWGAKGVTVCNEWRESYIEFKQWALANGYTNTLTIDKDELCEKLNISPKIYSPSTCLWKTMQENAINNQKLTEEQAKSLAILLEQGLATPQELGLQYNVSYRTVLKRTKPYRSKKYVQTSK